MATFSVTERLLLFAGLAMLCFAMMGSHFFSSRSRQRRAYWLSWLLGGSLVVVSVAHRGLDWALMPAGMTAFFSVYWAFMKTSYLKIGGRIFALTLDNRAPDPSDRADERNSPSDLPADRYGNLSAGSFWWLAAFLVAAAGAAVSISGWQDIRLITSAGFFTLAAGLVGYRDGAGGFTRVRGQRVPAVIAAAASILLFALPPALYLLGYELGCRSVADCDEPNGHESAEAPHLRTRQPPRP
jgi:hypothetical protein